MNYITELYYKSANELGLKTEVIPEIYGFRMTLGKQKYYFKNGHVPLNDTPSSLLAFHKLSTNALFQQAGVPVVKAMSLSAENFHSGQWDLQDLKFPLVIKPGLGTSCGLDVICNIQNHEVLTTLLDKYFKIHPVINIEEYLPGLNSYRVLVLDDKVIGIVERTPAQVVGDGQHNIQQLIQIINKDIEENRHVNPMREPIEINEETSFLLKEKGIDYHYVPAKDEIVPIRYICNQKRGGTIRSISTKRICPENEVLAVRAAKALNLRMVGLDMLCEDISTPISQSRGVILEANSNPNVGIHELSEGEPCQVTKFIIKKHIDAHPWFKAKHFLKKYAVTLMASILIIDLMMHLWNKFPF